MKESKIITSPSDYSDVAMGFEKRGDYRPVNCQNLATGVRGIVTTLDDLLKWINNYHDNQLGNRNQTLINRMQTKGVLNNGDSLRYGLGLFIEDYNGQKVIWHGGRETGFTSNITMFPDKKTSIIVLSNTMDRIPYEHRYDIAKIMFNNSYEFSNDPFPGMDLGKNILKNTEPTENNNTLTDYQGIYSINGFPRKFDISVKDGQLIANIADMTFGLKKHSPDVFISEPMIFQFIRDDKRQISGFLLHGEKFRNLELKRNN